MTAETYFPGENWSTLSAADVQWNTGALDEALAEARDFLSTGVVMLRDGKIVAEEYWPLPDLSAYGPQVESGAKRLCYGYTGEGYPLEDVASVQKSISAVLAAVAVEKGLIRYDDPVDKYLGVGWAKVTPEQSREVTIRNIMTMTSGLTEALEYDAPPNSKWQYNTGAYQNLLRILTAVSGLDANTLTREWLTGPIGMNDTRWEERGWANQDPPMMGLVTTPRDLARFGLLVLHRGSWQGRQIAPAAELDTFTRPSQSLNPSYGMLFWLNVEAGVFDPQAGKIVPGRRIPDAPADLLTAAGAMNRYVFMLPTEKIVIVRTGLVKPGDGDPNFGKSWWQTLSKVFG